MPLQSLTPGSIDRRLAITFFAVSLVVYYLIAIYPYDPCTHRFQLSRPMVSSGDEPHYLIMIASLLKDKDLNLGNNYESSHEGSLDAGIRRQGKYVDHHTLITDRRTGESALWNRVFGLTPEPCDPANPFCVGYNRVSSRFPDYSLNSPNFVERPWHAVPFPATVALFIAGAREESFEADAIYFVVFLSWFAGVITYACSLKAGLPPRWSLAVVAIVYFASPWLVYSHELFAMTFLGLLLIAALWAFLVNRFVIAAILITVASMQSEAFIVMMLAWAIYLYFFKDKKSALMFAIAGFGAVATASLVNIFLVGHVSLRGMWFTFNPVLWNAFVEPQRGLLFFAPWTVLVFVFIAVLMINHRRDSDRRLTVMLAGILPIVAIYLFLPDTGGDCFGPRYWVPFMPWMAILLALFIRKYWLVRPLLLRPLLVVLLGSSFVINITAAVMNASQVHFWQKPPWYAPRILLANSDQLSMEVSCPSRKTEYWLGADCGEPMPIRATVMTQQPVHTISLVLVSRLACAVQIVDATPVLRLHIFDANGEADSVNVIAGQDSSEWSYDCSKTREAVRHQRAQIFSSYEAVLNGQPCEGHRYITTLRLTKPTDVTKIEFEWLGGHAAISLHKVSLTDAATGASYSVDPELIRP